jgi:hydroxyacylglutathione hydrolase
MIQEPLTKGLQVHAIPAFKDNYVWMMHDGSNAAVVDPGEAEPVEKALAEMGLNLCAIVLTHLHYDHTYGVPKLLERWPVPVYGPKLIRHFQNQALFLWIASPIRSEAVIACHSMPSIQS